MQTREGTARRASDREAGASRPEPESPVVDAVELAPRCLALLDQVRRTGEEIIVARRGRPIARIVPLGDPDEDDESPTWDLEAIGP